MSEYTVRDVVSDYGVYEDDELKLILNSRRIALQIAELLKEDELIHRELNHIKDYPSYLDIPKPRPAANPGRKENAMKSTKANRKTYYIDPCTEGGQSSGFYEQKLTRKEAEQLKKENPGYFITDSYQKMLYFVQD